MKKQKEEWAEFDIKARSFYLGESYHPLEHGQDMQVRTKDGWMDVLYFYVRDEYVGIWVTPKLGVSAMKVDRTIDKVKFRMKQHVQADKMS